MTPRLLRQAQGVRLRPMAGQWSQKHWGARLGAQFVTMLTAGALLYAGMICLAGAAIGGGHSHENHNHGHAAEPAGDHHSDGHSESAPTGHHEGGAPDCCSNHLSTVPSSDPVVHKPHTETPPLLFLAVLITEPGIVPAHGSLWEHGPPGESPPLLFAILPQAPRAPPVAV
ncbi:MAG: hypothetical protein PCFJNLEI_01205 [Verrucomicrobiae bacterium]|nr:hypothetical protein [Verrucomicrobiae bacterium]